MNAPSPSTTFLFPLLASLCLVLVGRSAFAGTMASGPGAEMPAAAPPLQIKVDPRVELLSLLFRLAGNPEYNQGKVESYTADVEKQFGAYRDHAAVKLARELRQKRGVSYDACMSLAVHLTSVDELKTVVPLEPWPEGLDQRWTARDVARFLKAVREFAKDTGFAKFTEQHRPLYQQTEARMREVMEKNSHLEWFGEYFGERPQASFTLALGLLNGGCCYGARVFKPAGKEELYCVLGIWQTDKQGLPEFTPEMVGTTVHEFGHSYANPVIGRHYTELKPAGDELFRQVAAKMRSQAYGDSRTMLGESLVRACEVRYAVRYQGAVAARKAVAYEKGRGFLWTEELSNLLGEYEAHRDQYPTLEAFAPRLVAFFQEYSKDFSARQAAQAVKRPKIVSMAPANGAKDVDPNLKTLQVIFDRPMQNGGWALVGDQSQCPEGTGTPSFDATRTKWTVPIKLKPGFTYRFMLNSDSFDSFRSQEGVPLAPVSVTFTTRK